MTESYKFYLNHMNSNTGYRATWDPGKSMKLGQIGKLDKFGVFTVYSSLESEGIPIVIDCSSSISDMDYSSHSNLSIQYKMSGDTPIIGSVLSKADAGVSIDFNGEKGVVFQSVGNKTFQISNISAIEGQILKKYEAGNWDKSLVIVTEIVASESATVVISQSKNGKLELKANAKIGHDAIKITDASLGLVVAKEKGSTLKFLATSGLTPLYRVMGLQNPVLGLFGDPVLKTKGQTEDRFLIQDFKSEELEVA